MNTHPCRNKCTLATGGNYCKGCYRNTNEEANWLKFPAYRRIESFKSLIYRANKEKSKPLTSQNRHLFLDEMIKDHTLKLCELERKRDEQEKQLNEIRAIYKKHGICQQLLKKMFVLKDGKLIRRITISNGEAGTSAGTFRAGFVWVSVFGKMVKIEHLIDCYETGIRKFKGAIPNIDQEDHTIDISALPANQSPGSYIGYFTGWHRSES